MSEVPLDPQNAPRVAAGWLLITEFIKEDSPSCLTRAISRTMIGVPAQSGSDGWNRQGLLALPIGAGRETQRERQ